MERHQSPQIVPPPQPIPAEAAQAHVAVSREFGAELAGVYLFGSAVNTGGLQPQSDVDVLVVTRNRTTASARERLAAAFMGISGDPYRAETPRPLEVTVLAEPDIRPWRYPPIHEFLYGEWLRPDFERNHIPPPAPNPDLAIVITQARDHNVALVGRPAREVFDPVPEADLRRAIADTLPELLTSVAGDERNVLLTLARMWMTAATGTIASKDAAAAWARDRLTHPHCAALDLARRAYLGMRADSWDERDVLPLVHLMSEAIRRELSRAAE
ncbi:aminoglycoside adenylyltransferase family protein [Hoyosella sp. YIM 151337]|uniref:aminoglycoside adenylyltransferase family protein n=1 Tax=Hoyosella sp. YIM 151337 TaxID=2992742 RepID=UPI002235A66F|nr:aminoglycoside adenylyltransferase family protein [Hoyosella sp. YIM 151337]MCW4352619.1 aminoglycoside adenylyltransferase family protein [Hoyosella sp. YIM 151337]